jgi:hypothetical protein
MKTSKDILNYGWFMKFGAISLNVMVVVVLLSFQLRPAEGQNVDSLESQVAKGFGPKGPQILYELANNFTGLGQFNWQ